MGIICSNRQNMTEEIETNISHQQYQAVDKIFENTLKEYEYPRRDQYHYGRVKTKFLVAQTKTKQLIYLKDGQILRIDQIKDCSSIIEVLNNLDQIRNLQCVGKQGKDNKKVGMWTASWNGERLHGVGGNLYSDDGLKQGLWKELRNNYSNYAPIYEIGEYVNNQRRGMWKFIQKNNIIGSGNYSDQGKRNGKWIELSNYFYSKCQVSYVGEYKDGRKVGIWLIDFNNRKRNNQLIGGGLYIEKQEEDGFIKKGKWVEELEGYDEYLASHVTFWGEYKNGIKIGIWDTEHLYNCNRKLGGGLDESQLNVDGLLTSVKVGKWIDLCDCFHYYRYITYEGEYKNGIKIGSWDINWEQTKIGGGFYEDKNGDEIIEDTIKIGKWIEQSDTFNHIIKEINIIYLFDQLVQTSEKFQINYVGEYQNGKKHGKWDIYFRCHSKQLMQFYFLFQQCWGQYEVKQKDGVFYSSKIGFWTEIFELFDNGRSISYSSEYENGLKVGRWNTFFVSIFWEKVQFIGGGYYSILEEQDFLGSLKSGKWIEVETEYFNHYFIISTGEYNYGRKSWQMGYLVKRRKGKHDNVINNTIYMGISVVVDHIMKQDLRQASG